MSSILEEIRLKKRLYGYTNEEMARRSGLPLSTVRKVLGGSTKSPGLKTVEALWQAFPEQSAPLQRTESGAASLPRTDPGAASLPEPEAWAVPAQDNYAYPSPEPAASLVREAEPAYALEPEAEPFYPFTNAPRGKYPRQGSYTLEDYLALPDDQRVELIDGVFYDMSAPTIPHQLIGGALYTRIANFLSGRKAPCVPLIAPTDVQLDRDNKTILQPDVMVVCHRDRFTTARLYGAPDFVAEVLSPSTRGKDILIKTNKYRNAGVKEYWMVDPRNETVTKMLFSAPDDEEPDGNIRTRTYSFDEPVPVTLFGDELSISFREIADSYAFLFTDNNKNL